MLNINNLSNVEHILWKANSYNSENLVSAFKKLKSHSKVEKISSKFDHDRKEQMDSNYLIFRQPLSENEFNKLSKKINDQDLLIDCDDGASYEANIFYYLVCGLFQ